MRILGNVSPVYLINLLRIAITPIEAINTVIKTRM